jgi:hypothetical protein
MKRYTVAGLVLSALILPPLAFLLYLILEERGLLPAAWPDLDLADLRLAWDQAGEYVAQVLGGPIRRNQTGNPRGVDGGTIAPAPPSTTPPKSHLHRAFERWWDELWNGEDDQQQQGQQRQGRSR